MNGPILGLDIGGANIKLAHTSGAARTSPFRLWQHHERLRDELASLIASMPAFGCLAVTMTGELCDCFSSRSVGVAQVLTSLPHTVDAIDVWCNTGRFCDLEQALADPLSVASANWLAQALWIARQYPRERVLLIDAGSTTTDIVYLERGGAAPRGRTDAARLAVGELVYTGARRTPVCAVLGMEVAAELFATMLDAYLMLNLHPEATADNDTADGRPATRTFAHARLARLRCQDAESFSEADARQLAQRAIAVQVEGVCRAVDRVLEGHAAVDRVVLSGSGEVLGRRVQETHARLRSVPTTALSEMLGPALSEAACAYAVAMLAANRE